MSCGSHVFALWVIVISATSVPLWAQKRGNGDRRGEYGLIGGFGGADGGEESSDNGSESAFLCSYAGNCTCVFTKLGVTVKCTSVGNELDKIAYKLPETTTHL